MTRAERLRKLHGLYGIVDDDPAFTLDPFEWAQALADGGAPAIQLRFKRTPMGPALALARKVRAAFPQLLLLINDRPDMALACGADGVHLGDDDLPPADARRLLGPDLLVGATARDTTSALARLAEGADHLGVGPVFASATKAIDHPPLGPAGLAAVCRAVLPVPVVAISGIDRTNIEEVAKAGAACAAVIAAVGRAPDPRAAAAALRAVFDRGHSMSPDRSSPPKLSAIAARVQP